MFNLVPCFHIAIIVVAILAAAPVQAEPEGEQPASQERHDGTATPTLPSAQSQPQGKKPANQEQREGAATPAPTTPSCTDAPWYCDVSEVDRARALELYAQANRFFDDTSFPVAIERYRAALAYWNHPGIQYNLMLALVVLENPIEAYQASMEALRYGVKALKLEEYRRALDYQRLLRRQVAYVEVTCDEPGAVVSLDGKDILFGPGTVRIPVLPGQRELVAKKAGYLTTQHSLVAETGKPARVQMRLLPQSQATIPVRRWSNWRPWAVVSAGVGLGLVGGLLEWRADVTNIALQDLYPDTCMIGPCPVEPNAEMRSLHKRYQWYRRVGHGTSIAGGMAVLGGLMLVYLNRQQHIENPERRDLVNVTVIPSVIGNTAGLTVHAAF